MLRDVAGIRQAEDPCSLAPPAVPAKGHKPISPAVVAVASRQLSQYLAGFRFSTPSINRLHIARIDIGCGGACVAASLGRHVRNRARSKGIRRLQAVRNVARLASGGLAGVLASSKAGASSKPGRSTLMRSILALRRGSTQAAATATAAATTTAAATATAAGGGSVAKSAAAFMPTVQPSGERVPMLVKGMFNVLPNMVSKRKLDTSGAAGGAKLE